MSGIIRLFACVTSVGFKARGIKAGILESTEADTTASAPSSGGLKAYKITLETGREFTVLTTEEAANIHNAIIERFCCTATDVRYTNEKTQTIQPE